MCLEINLVILPTGNWSPVFEDLETDLETFGFPLPPYPLFLSLSLTTVIKNEFKKYFGIYEFLREEEFKIKFFFKKKIMKKRIWFWRGREDGTWRRGSME